MIKKNAKNIEKVDIVSSVDLNLNLGDIKYPPKEIIKANMNALKLENRCPSFFPSKYIKNILYNQTSATSAYKIIARTVTGKIASHLATSNLVILSSICSASEVVLSLV